MPIKKISTGIHTAIIIFAVCLIITVAALVMIISQNRYLNALHNMTDRIVIKTADNISENITQSIGTAVRVSGILDVLFQQFSDTEKHETEIVRMLMAVLESRPNVYSLYYGDEYGNFFLVGRRKDSTGSLRYFTKQIKHVGGRRMSFESWLDKNGKKVGTRDISEFDKYVPKLRPWYVNAAINKKAAWSDPYVFFITGEPGITYAVPVYKNGFLAGVCGVDIEIKMISLNRLSSFTSNTKFFLLDENNHVMAHSGIDDYFRKHKKNLVPSTDKYEDKIMTAMLREHYARSDDTQIFNLDVSGQMFKAVIEKKNIAGLRLLVGTYTPYNDYLAVIFEGNREIIYLTIIVIIVSIFISIAISASLAKPFIILSRAAENTKNYEFDKSINVCSRFTEAQSLVKNFNNMLNNLSEYKTQNEMLNRNLKDAYLDTMYRLALAAEYKDHFTAEHLNRVSSISVFIAEALGMSRHDTELIKHASAMHDVGKIGIPDDILVKPGKLTAEEFEAIKLHTLIGEKMLQNPSSEIMEKARIVALSHHEKWNGGGYPNKLQGEDIPLFGRIVSVADVIDALVSRRTYKEAYTFEKAIDIITLEKGKQFQPELIDLVLENKERVRTFIYKP